MSWENFEKLWFRNSQKLIFYVIVLEIIPESNELIKFCNQGKAFHMESEYAWRK